MRLVYTKGPVVGFDTLFAKLRSLVQVLLELDSEATASSIGILLHGPTGVGKRELLYNVANSLGIHFLQVFGNVLIYGKIYRLPATIILDRQTREWNQV